MIDYWGYQVEEHKVTTEDGYILTMHRILASVNAGGDSKQVVDRPPVFLAHCLLCSSAVFSFGPPEQSLGFILADQGEKRKKQCQEEICIIPQPISRKSLATELEKVILFRS